MGGTERLCCWYYSVESTGAEKKGIPTMTYRRDGGGTP